MDPIIQNATSMIPKSCFLLKKDLHYNGIFFGQNPLDHIIPTFMLQIILSVSVSRIIHIILSPLRQSKFVCNILAGVILGPSVLGRNKTYMEKMFATKEMLVLATMSHMAVYLYIFLIFIKADASMLTRAPKNAWKLGICCLVFPIILTMSLALGLQQFLPGISPVDGFAVQFSILSSLSYFVVITQAMDELKLLSSELGQLSSSITCLNEVGASFLVISALALRNKETKHSVYVVICLCLLVMFAIFVIRPILFWIINNTPKGKPVKECHVIAILISTLLMGVITDAIGASFFVGFIIMGCLIPDGPPLGATIIRKCELILFEFLLPMFFVRIGYYTDLSICYHYKEFLLFGVFRIVGYIGRVVPCLLLSPSLTMKKRDAVILSLILSQEGVVELVQAIQWRHEGLIDVSTFPSTVYSLVVLNAIITPIIAIVYNPVVENSDLPNYDRVSNRSLGMTSINEELRIITCIQEEDNVPSIISLLEAMNPKDVTSICAYVIHIVAVCSQSVPKLVPYRNHLRKFCQPSGSDSIVRAFLNYAGHSQGLVQIQPFRMISPYKYMHQHVSRLGETISSPLIIMPFFKAEEAHGTDGTLRIFNTNIQAVAKCTVGLLVDRGLQSPTSLTTFSYNMAVIFVGGADDREALSMASRASHHPNVRITVLRIDISGKHNTLGAQIETQVDDVLFREFKAMNANNGSVVCDEYVAHDIEDVMKALRTLSKAYDLVVVGKRHRIPELQALSSWVQYPELGEIGDAIAASDFMGGRMSILVLQHCGDENKRVSGSFSS